MVNRLERHAALQDLFDRAQKKDAPLAPIIKEVLDRFGGELWLEARTGFQSELTGYSGGIEYYQQPPLKPHQQGYMPEFSMRYRERGGTIKVVLPDGTHGHVKNILRDQTRFLITAPIASLEGLLKVPGYSCVVEMPELTELIGREEDGTIILVVDKTDIEEIVEVARRRVVSVLTLLLHPEKSVFPHS